jgi:17 kDa common-antigen outer membrane protein
MGMARIRFGRGWTLAVLAAGLLAGCAETGGGAPSAGAETPVAISDPVVAFAASASPGAEDSVVIASTGQTARVRLVRAYTAASGRECREVAVRTGGGSETRLLCRAGTGWREARPLLRGAASAP